MSHPHRPQHPRRIGVIGAGQLGRALIRELTRGPAATHNTLVAVLARRARAEEGVAVTDDVEAFLAARPDLIIELAGPAALAAHAARALAVAPVWSVSPSALADEALHQSLLDVIARHGHPLRILNGAIGALDAIGTASVSSTELSLTIRVPTDAIEEAQLFDGSVREAIGLFPRNINVAAAAALAGPGLDRTRVRILTPGVAAGHAHRLEVRGPLLQAEFSARPGHDAEADLRPTAASAIRALRQLDAPIVIG